MLLVNGITNVAERLDSLHAKARERGSILETENAYVRAVQHMELLRAHEDELLLLEHEGVLSLDPWQSVGIPERVHTQVLKQEYDGLFDTLNRLVRGGEFPPSLVDVGILIWLANKEPDDLGDDFWLELVRTGEVYRYLIRIAVMAEQHGAVPISSRPIFRSALYLARRCHPLPSIEPTPMRAPIAGRLAHTLIEWHLPRAEDLPVGELLEVRRRRSDELEAFRIGLAAVATELDLSQDEHAIELQIQDLVAKKINLAVRDLKVALEASRLDALKKVGQSWSSLAKATVPAALAYAAGAPLDISAALALLGAAAVPFFESAIDRKKLLNASQWSILFRLEGIQKGR
jgi:hypothetical protein